MAKHWDIFHTDRLEAERNLSTEAVRAAVASGAIRPDDLVRPAGSSDMWARIGDTPELRAPASPSQAPPKPTPTQKPKPPQKPTQKPTPTLPPASSSMPSPPRPTQKPPQAEPPRAARPKPPAAEAPGASGRGPSTPTPPGPTGTDRPGRATPIEATPPPPDEPGPPPDEPILDAELIEIDDDILDAEILDAEIADEPVLDAEIADEPVLDAEIVEDEAHDDFDDSIPAPSEGSTDEQTVELPPRSPSAPTGRAGTGIGAAAGVGIGAGAGAIAGAGSGAIPSPGLSDRAAPPVVDTSAETITSAELFGLFDPTDEDEEAAAFTLAAEPADEPDEIDLTAMVDVAFQLVLFFLVTATTLYFKTLEIPTPDPEDPDAVAQQMRTLDDLLDEYILVEIDPQGRVEIDREPIDVSELTDRLRQARADTLRTGMLLMADFATPHRNAVQAIDSANALGLQIAIAKPASPPD